METEDNKCSVTIPRTFIMKTDDYHEFYSYKKFLSNHLGLVYNVKEHGTEDREYKATFSLIDNR